MWPFDAYQTVMLLIAGAGALAGYFHMKFLTNQNTRDIASQKLEAQAMLTRVHNLEITDAARAQTLSNVERNLSDSLGKMERELGNQRSITQQLEKLVARLSGIAGVEP